MALGCWLLVRGRFKPQSLQQMPAMDKHSAQIAQSCASAGCVQITGNIHQEVDSQHAVLDRMAQSMGGIQLGLGASVNKFKTVRLQLTFWEVVVFKCRSHASCVAPGMPGD